MKKRNRGFTLVELIIVVAIIAILASVLAPQYLQYVERARQSNDLQIATSLMKATTIIAADPNSNLSDSTYITIRWDTANNSNGPNPSGGTGGITAEFRPAYAAASEWSTKFEEEIRTIMGVAEGEISIGEPQSNAAKEDDLLFRIDIATGRIDVHTLYADTWVDKVGVDADVASF